MKVLVLLCCMTLARAGIIGTAYSPASLSTVYSSINTPVITKTFTNPVIAKTITPVTYTKTYAVPAPVYESVLSTHESRTKSLDGTQLDTFSKSLDTAYSSVKKFESRSTNDISHSVPTIYSHIHTAPINTQPAAYSLSSPVVRTPITYTTHDQSPVSTRIPSLETSVYPSPVVTKTITPVVSHTSHAPVVQAHPAVKLTYSDAPLVSHMTFTGLGTSYSW